MNKLILITLIFGLFLINYVNAEICGYDTEKRISPTGEYWVQIPYSCGGGGGGSYFIPFGFSPEYPIIINQGESIDIGDLSSEKIYVNAEENSFLIFSYNEKTYGLRIDNFNEDNIKFTFDYYSGNYEIYPNDLKISGQLKINEINERDYLFNKTLNILPKYNENKSKVNLEIWLSDYDSQVQEPKPNYTRLWIILIAVIVVSIIWYLGRKKE